MSRNIRRIDQCFADLARWSWKRLIRFRDHLALWFRYTFLEPYTDPSRANDALRGLCRYQIHPCTKVKLKCIIPWFSRFRFGVLVFFVPNDQRSRFWTLCWVRWVDDPLELFLIRSATRGTVPLQPIITRTRNKASQSQPPVIGLLDSMSSEDMDALLT